MHALYFFFFRKIEHHRISTATSLSNSTVIICKSSLSSTVSADLKPWQTLTCFSCNFSADSIRMGWNMARWLKRMHVFAYEGLFQFQCRRPLMHTVDNKTARWIQASVSQFNLLHPFISCIIVPPSLRNTPLSGIHSLWRIFPWLTFLK